MDTYDKAEVKYPFGAAAAAKKSTAASAPKQAPKKAEPKKAEPAKKNAAKKPAAKKGKSCVFELYNSQTKADGYD